MPLFEPLAGPGAGARAAAAEGHRYLHLSLTLPMDATTDEGGEDVATASPERHASLATAAVLHGIRKLLSVVRSRDRH